MTGYSSKSFWTRSRGLPKRKKGTRPIVSIIEGPSSLAGQDLLYGQRKTRRDKNTVLVRF